MDDEFTVVREKERKKNKEGRTNHDDCRGAAPKIAVRNSEEESMVLHTPPLTERAIKLLEEQTALQYNAFHRLFVAAPLVVLFPDTCYYARSGRCMRERFFMDGDR